MTNARTTLLVATCAALALCSCWKGSTTREPAEREAEADASSTASSDVVPGRYYEEGTELPEGYQVINGVIYGPLTVNTVAEGPEHAPYTNELVGSSMSDPKTFNPFTANETSSTTAFAYVFEGLTTSDGVTLEVKPLLAERWEVADDKLTWTFHLRRNVKFHDGTPMTADDVVFSFNDIVMNDDIAGIAMRDILTMAGGKVRCEKVDEYTVRFITPEPFAPFDRIIGGFEIVPKYLIEPVVRSGGFSHHWNVGCDVTTLVGTGPYRLTRYKNGELLVQERWDGYWQNDAFPEPGPIAARKVRIIPHMNAAVLRFKSGETDVLGLRMEDYAKLQEAARDKNFTIYDMGGSTGALFLVFNQSTVRGADRGIPPHMQRWFRDVQFRRAIAHAVDKESIIRLVQLGFAEPLWSPVPPSNVLFHNPNVRTYPFNLAKARELLDAAGYIDHDGDGVREMPRGTPVRFVLTTNTGHEVRIRMCQIIQEDLKALGLDVTFQPLEFNNLVSKLQDTYDWEAMVLGLTGGIEPHFGRNVWATDGRTHMWNQRPTRPSDDEELPAWEESVAAWKAGLRPWEYEIERLFDEGVKVFDFEQRRQVYFEWQQIVSEQLPFIYLTTAKSLVAVRNKFIGLKPTAYGTTFHNLDSELMVLQ
jgi:peptide/nickel transport system substrate-binding protein